MNWIDAICSAIRFIEEHITDELTVDMIADRVNVSSFYFQKGFAMLCGFTISEYIILIRSLNCRQENRHKITE